MKYDPEGMLEKFKFVQTFTPTSQSDATTGTGILGA